jgi:hypothetical protein
MIGILDSIIYFRDDETELVARLSHDKVYFANVFSCRIPRILCLFFEWEKHFEKFRIKCFFAAINQSIDDRRCQFNESPMGLSDPHRRGESHKMHGPMGPGIPCNSGHCNADLLSCILIKIFKRSAMCQIRPPCAVSRLQECLCCTNCWWRTGFPLLIRTIWMKEIRLRGCMKSCWMGCDHLQANWMACEQFDLRSILLSSTHSCVLWSCWMSNCWFSTFQRDWMHDNENAWNTWSDTIALF